MKVEYNGVELTMLEMHSYERKNVYSTSGADHLYVRHALNMTCALAAGGHPYCLASAPVYGNDQRIAEKPNPRSSLKGVPPQFGDTAFNPYKGVDPLGGEQAGVTDRIIIPLLLVPRKKLKITGYRPSDGGAFTWLESPRPGLSVDCLSGPHPLGCVLAEPTGDAPASGVLNFQIETHLPLAESQSARAIISHRWSTTLSHDEDYYPTRTIHGEVVFDVGLMAFMMRKPDDFLSQLYHPIPVGYRRGLPEVGMADDGSRLSYTITDTKVAGVFDPANTGATNMWINEQWHYTSPHGFHPAQFSLNGAGVAGDFVESVLPVPSSTIANLITWAGRNFYPKLK